MYSLDIAQQADSVLLVAASYAAGVHWMYPELAAIFEHAIDQPTPHDIAFKAYPNPCKESVVFRFQLKQLSHVRISIYNSLGQLVDVLINEVRPGGENRVIWNTSDLAMGTYFCQISSNGHASIKEIILIE